MADNDGFEPAVNQQANGQEGGVNTESAPQSGSVIMPGQPFAEPSAPIQQTVTPAQPTVDPEPVVATEPAAPGVSSTPGLDGSAAVPQLSNGGQKPKKKWLLPALVVGGFVLAVGAFFGIKQYTNSPNYVWNKSLSNTASGYKALVSALENYESKNYKASELNGTVNAKFTGGSVDITMKGSSGEKDAEIKTDVVYKGGEGNNTVSVAAGLDIIVVGENETSGDLYIRARDLDKAVNALSQSGMDVAQVQQMIQPYNNQWFVVSSEELVSMLGEDASLEELAADQPKAKDITDFLSSLNSAMNDQLLSADKDKAVLIQKEFIGKETKNGRDAFHYKAGVNKEHFKSFGKSLEKAYVDSNLGKWLADDSGLTASEMFNYSAFESMVNDINDDYTFDVWVDAASKRVSTLRFANENANNEYIELGILQNGNKVDLFITSKAEDSDAKYTLTFDASSHVIDMALKVVGGDDENAFTADISLNIKPTNDEPKVEKPSGVKSLQQLMESFGSSSQMSGLYGSPSALGQTDLQMYEELYGDEATAELERSLLFSN